MKRRKQTFEPLAIVGMSCLFPKAQTIEDYWANIKEKVDAITEVPITHWNPEDYFDTDKKRPDHVYAKTGGFLDPVDFSPGEWGIAPSDLDSIDTSQLLSLVVAQGALQDAGYGNNKEFNRDNVSVILGLTGTLELVVPLGARLGHPIWRKAMQHAGISSEITNEVINNIGKAYVGWQENSFPGLLGNVAAGRIANRLNLGGTNCVVDAACGSSLSAINLAAMELWTGKTDMAITGGVDTFNDIFMYMCFCKTPALSATGHARPFSSDNDGTILGEGIGMVVLKRLSDAERDGDKIYACINAVGTSSDGKGKAIYAPSASGQVKAFRRAYEQADITPEEIGLIEAHGTGTGAGDEVEATALKEVYGTTGTNRPWCALGSVKSQIGHTKAAAGSAGLIKGALALYHKVIPPTIKVTQPAAALKPENVPFYLPDNCRPWITDDDKPRFAAISALGFGGSNFHVVMSEYKHEKQEYDWQRGTELLTFSAASIKDLRTSLNKLVEAKKAYDVRKLAAESRKEFNHSAPYRLAIAIDAATDRSKIVSDVLAQFDKNPDVKNFALPNGAYFSSEKRDDKIGIIFPGQGAQYPGMSVDLVCSSPEAFVVMAQANNETGALDASGNRLIDYVYPRPTYDSEKDKLNDERLRATDIAQPAIGAIALGQYKALEAFGVEAAGFAGHSYGELVSLCAAGVFDSSVLAKLSRKRGQLMSQGEGDRGGMIAVAAERKAVEAVIAEEKLDLVVANHNAPQQVVLSGKTSEIARSKDIFKNRKMRGTVLNVAGAFHSSFVADAAEPFHVFLKKEKFEKPARPVYANTTADLYPQKADDIKKLLGFQLANQVRFVEIIEKMYADGIRTFIEAGPGGKMTGLIKAILEGKECSIIAVDSSAGKRSGLTDLARVLAQLSSQGCKLAIQNWQNGEKWLAEQPQSSKPRMTFPVSGSNYKSKDTLKALEELQKPVTVKVAAISSQAPQTRPAPATPVAITSAPAAAHTPVQPAVNQPARPTNQMNNNQQNNNVPANNDALRMSRETLSAMQQLQQQTADLHRRFLEGQEHAQKTILALINGNMSGGVQANNYAAPSVQQQPRVQHSAPAAVSYHQPAAVTPVATTPPASIAIPQPKPVVQAPAAAARPAADTGKTRTTLLEVVSEKTGYPIDMLNLDMDMEADLGIDSIKRVEIMSAMQERLPNAPVVQPDQLGKLRTLAQILAHLGTGADSANTKVQPAIATQPAAAASNVQPVLLEVVSEKTGYPIDMLNLDMDMEADLGIDSIKRVEIMSAMQERLPNAPVVQPDQLGKLRTLAQILQHLGSSANAPAATSQAPVNHFPSNDRVKPVLLEVVSEKTGYPIDMLNLDMDMEADLGIDSIKRVEIMSAMQERLPDAPVVQPDQLGKLRTLAQILDHLGSSTQASTQSAPSVSSAANEILPILIAIVSDKTGYPADMLNLDMDMEADLGIDSIKRVEIMSAVQERLPDAPVIQPDQLGKLRTLGQIITFLGGSATAAPVKAAQSSSSAIAGTLLDVIADKTGYPIDMLNPEMDMEADLGIDSIKRVEILSAFQERVPDAPVVQPGDLGKFRTISQILEYLSASQTPVKSSAPTQTAAAAQVTNANAPVINAAPAGHPIKRTVLQAVELPGEPSGSKVLNTGDLVAITDDDAALAEAMNQSLARHGIKSEVLSLGDIAGAKFSSKIKGLIIIAPQPEKAQLNLWESQSEEWLKDTFMAAQKAGPVIRQNGGGLFATVSRLDGAFALESLTKTVDPVQGGLAGLTKTIKFEWPEIVARAIDLDYRFKDNEAAANKLTTELLVTGPLETGLTRAARYGLHENIASVEENNSAPATFHKGDVIIVTGGARGVTAETAIAFAEKYQTTMVLLGRSASATAEPAWLKSLTAEPTIKAAIIANSSKKLTPKELEAEFKAAMANREVLHNLDRIRNAGARAFYYSVDIRNSEETEKIINQARNEAGSIQGLIHGAGVLRDRRIEDKTRDQLDDVIDTKIAGLRNVLKAIFKDNLKAVIMFSSFSGRFGRLGQVDYAMANEVLNKVSQKLRILRPECRTLSFNWGPWDGGMVTPSLRNVFLAEGIGLIPLNEGARQPIVELTNPDESAVEIGIIGVIEGQGAADTGKKLEKAYELELSLKNNPWLNDHVLNGDPVVPMAVTTELLTHAAMLTNPGLKFCGYDEMRILKGIVLKSGHEKVMVYAGRPEKSGQEFKVSCEIRTIMAGREIVNARAVVILSSALSNNRPAPLQADTHLVFPDSINEVYQNQLFHGDFLKSLTRVDGWSETGIAANSKTASQPGQWFAQSPMTHWCSDPLLVDAAYQLMILWTTQACGLPSLPGYAKRYRQYVPSFSNQEVKIVASARRSGTMMATADIDFVDQSGKVLARLEGYECTMNENLKNAFKLRSVVGAQ